MARWLSLADPTDQSWIRAKKVAVVKEALRVATALSARLPLVSPAKPLSYNKDEWIIPAGVSSAFFLILDVSQALSMTWTIISQFAYNICCPFLDSGQHVHEPYTYGSEYLQRSIRIQAGQMAGSAQGAGLSGKILRSIWTWCQDVRWDEVSQVLNLPLLLRAPRLLA